MALTMVSATGSWLLDVRLSKYELQVSIDDAFASLACEVSGVPTPAWDVRTPHGWSIADHVAHLAAWEALELARAEGRTGTPEILGLWVEALRRKFRGGARGRDAWRRFEELHQRLVRAVWDLPEAALRRPWNPACPTTLAVDLAWNTFEHYREHLGKIRELLSHSS